MKFVEFHELAEKELINSRDYYDNLIFGLGKKFILEVEHVIERIKNNPSAFPQYFEKFRKALLRKFPYSIIYKDDGLKIFILAIAHQKRRPKYFVRRISY
jgi:plasmid stabilization system protein ParE